MTIENLKKAYDKLLTIEQLEKDVYALQKNKRLEDVSIRMSNISVDIDDPEPLILMIIREKQNRISELTREIAAL